MIRVEPIKPEERPRCAYCGKGMHPRYPEQQRFKSEAELAAFSTNRRVYAMRRSMGWRYDRLGNKEPTGQVAQIEISFLPTDKSRWGSDGLFCTGDHAKRFAYAALKAGYRIKR